MEEKVTSLASSIDSMKATFEDHKRHVNSDVTTTTSEMEKELKKMETALSVLEESKEKFGNQLSKEIGELQKDVSVLKIQRSEDEQMIENRLEALEQSEAAQRHEMEEMSQMFSEIKQQLYDYSRKMKQSASRQNTWMLEQYEILEQRVGSIEKKFLVKKNLQKRWSSLVSIPSQGKEHHHSRKVLSTSPVKARDHKRGNRITEYGYYGSSPPTSPFGNTFSTNDGEVFVDQQNSSNPLSPVHLRTQNSVKSPKKRFSFPIFK